MTKAVLIGEQENDISEIDLDITQIFLILKGPATFIGQWPELDVVIMKCRESIFELVLNHNVLPAPFETEAVLGPILLVRMNADSEPEDFTVQEYFSWVESSANGSPK